MSLSCPRLRVLYLALLLVLPANAIDAEPRPLSAAETRAVGLWLDVCERGHEAIIDALAADAPLAHLDQRQALEEIEVRLGPACSGDWTLETAGQGIADTTAVLAVELAAGFDDVAALEFVEEGGELRLLHLRSLIDSGERPVDSDEAVLAREPTSLASGSAVAAVALLAAFGVLLVAWRRRADGPRLVSTRLRTVLGLLLVTLLLDCRSDRPAPEATASDHAGSFLRAGELLPLRRALLDGRSIESPPSLSDPRLAEIATLWRAQSELALGRVGEVATHLAEVPEDSVTPLAWLLRGRYHLLTQGDAEAALAYEKAIELLPPHDGLWLEAATAMELLGYKGPSDEYYAAALGSGSRDAELYYSEAENYVLGGSLDRAEEWFTTAWALRPKSRRQAFGSPVLGFLLDPDRDLFELLSADKATEPLTRSVESKSQTLIVPKDLRAEVSGAYARIEGEDFLFEIPKGADLLPADTPIIAAGSWEKEAEVEALEQFDSLVEMAARPAALARPQFQEEIDQATAALERRHRWEDLVRLTEPLDDVTRTPSAILRRRAYALHYLDQPQASLRLLASVAQESRRTHRKDPATLYALSDLLAREGEFDSAIKLLAQAYKELPNPAIDVRIQQLRLDQALAEEFEDFESDHFVVRHPPGRDRVAERIASVLEAERTRLMGFIPTVPTAPKIEVHLLRFNQFSDRYAGSVDVLGIFDGRIRVPLADMWGFHPFLVTLLSHELAHAMIDDYTHGQAPKWLHEGLAQRVEMVENRINPIEDYERSGRLLAFPVVESALEGFSNPKLVAAAYDEALWALLYLEKTRGIKGIHRLLDAFRQGLATEEAIATVLDRDIPTFDAEMREWWLDEAPPILTSEVHLYEKFTDPYVRRAGDDGDPLQLNLRWWQSDSKGR